MTGIVDLDSRADVIAVANAYDHTEKRPFSVRINIDCLLDRKTRPALWRLLKRFSSPPASTHRSLKLYDSSSETRRSVPASLVATTIRQLGTITSLTLDEINFDLQDGAHSFLTALASQQWSLQTIDFGLNSHILGDETALTNFGNVLMDMTTLEELTMSFNGMSTDEVCIISSFLPHIRRLESLDLHHWAMPTEEASTAFLTNLSMGSIKKLWIRPTKDIDLMKGSALDAIESLLSTTRLERLFIEINSLAAMRRIAKALGQANRHLTRIHIWVRDSDFDVKCALTTDDIAGPFLEMLSTKNFALTKLDITCRVDGETLESSDHPDIAFYLNLNALGRHYLLMNGESNATDQDWLNVILASSDDVPSTFYWLTCNPSFCEKANPSILEKLDCNMAAKSESSVEEPEQVCFGDTWVTLCEINSKNSVFVGDSQKDSGSLRESHDGTDSCCNASAENGASTSDLSTDSCCNASAENEASTTSDLSAEHKWRSIYLAVGIIAAFIVGCYFHRASFKA